MKLLEERILLYLYNWDAKDNKSNLKNLSRILSISESDVSAALKNLMNKELIEKMPLYDNVIFSLTIKGEKYAKKLDDQDAINWLFSRNVKETLPSENILNTNTANTGKIYLIEDLAPKLVYKKFYSLIHGNSKALILSRPAKRGFIENNEHVKTYWFTKIQAEDSIDPTKIVTILLTITSTLSNGDMLFLDGIDFLATHNGEDSIVKFIHQIIDYVTIYNITFILPISVDSVSKRMLAILEGETNVIKNEKELNAVGDSEQPPKNGNKYEQNNFVDRETYLTKMNDILKLSGESVLIWGIAGIGKSSIVKKYLEDKKNSIIWIDLYEGISELHIMELIATHLSTLNRPYLSTYLSTSDSVNRSVIEKIFYDDVQAIPDLLIIFDNIQYAVDVLSHIYRILNEVMKKSKKGNLILLGREKASDNIFSSINDIYVSGFDLNGTISFLKLKDITNERVVKEIHKITSGHPLLLTLIDNESDLSIIDSNIKSFIDKSINSKLTDTERDLLGKVSIYRYPVPEYTITKDDKDKSILKQLIKKGFVYVSNTNLISIHDLIREYFNKYSSEDLKKRWHELAYDHYLNISNKTKEGIGVITYEMVYHAINCDKIIEAKSSLVKHYLNMIDAGLGREMISLVNMLLNKDSNDASLFILHAILLETYDEKNNALTEYIKILNVLKKQKMEYDNLLRMGKIHERVAYIYIEMGSIDNAKKHFEHCQDIAFNISSPELLVSSYNGLGTVYSSLKKMDTSLEFYKKAIDIAKKIADLSLECNIYNNISNLYLNNKEYDMAMEYSSKGLDIAERYNLLNEKGTLLNTFGRIEKYKKNWEKAYELLIQAQIIITKRGKQSLLGTIDTNLGLLSYLLNEQSRGEKYFNDAYYIFDSLNNKKLLFYFYITKAVSMIHASDIKKAINIMNGLDTYMDKDPNLMQIYQILKDLIERKNMKEVDVQINKFLNNNYDPVLYESIHDIIIIRDALNSEI